jgi:ketopantoate reductase
VLGKTIVGYSAVGTYVRMFISTAKEADTSILFTSDGGPGLDD